MGFRSLKVVGFLKWGILLVLGVGAQQMYENNLQLNCPNNSSDITFGYACNGERRNCQTYAVYRAQVGYQSVARISALLNSDAAQMADINNVGVNQILEIDRQIIAPINCSCAGNYSQSNAPYVVKANDNYFFIANNTFEGLTACQALIRQNPYPVLDLPKGKQIRIPLRCACPTREQARNGIKYLLSYLVTWGDDIPAISSRFGASKPDTLDANQLLDGQTIYPFTTILVPLAKAPKSVVSPPPPPPPPPPLPPPKGNKSSNTGLHIGIVMGAIAGVIFVVGIAACLFFSRRKRQPIDESPLDPPKERALPEDLVAGLSEMGHALPRYKLEDLKAATQNFSPSCRIQGSVYRGVMKGTTVAIKQMKGHVSPEMNILTKINHSSLIRLAGLCVSQGHSYLVYEYAENGSLSDCIRSTSSVLSWRQRVQIAFDVANGLHYLHSYANPPYVHKDIKSSNILLNGDYRAKISNFGLARTGGGEGFALTKHVAGTKGYMAPEYVSHGLVTPALDVFSFGVVLLEIISAKDPVSMATDGQDILLYAAIDPLINGDNPKEMLRCFVDPSLRDAYPVDIALNVAHLAHACVQHDYALRPTFNEIVISLSALLASSCRWESDPTAVSGTSSVEAAAR